MSNKDNKEVTSRDLTPKEIRKFVLGQRIWKQWKVNFGPDRCMIKGKVNEK